MQPLPSSRPVAMWNLLPILFLSSSLLVATTNAYDDPWYTDCPSNTNYTRGSAFQANLDALLSSLPAVAAASSGFARNVTGAATGQQAYGLAQCRGDLDASACLACLDIPARRIVAACHGQKQAMLIYDECLLRHSNESFFGVVDTSVVYFAWSSLNVTRPEEAAPGTATLMRNLTARAAYASPKMFAAGVIPLTLFVNLYGFAQCTRDLTPDDCGLCLSQAFDFLRNGDGKMGGRVVLRTCSIRFEAYRFYNNLHFDMSSAPAPAAVGVPGDGPTNASDNSAVTRSTGRNRTATTALLVSIPVVGTLLVSLLVAVYLFKSKRNRKPRKLVQIARAEQEDTEDMIISEDLIYELRTLRAATDDFSVENKLGEGGFGTVYKGTLQHGQEIAVKRLSATSQQGQVEMKNEVVLLAKLQHRNLVRLLGCCIEEHERLLVYEFLTNNNLAKILFNAARQQELSWEMRHKIIKGIGRGFLYLHEDSRLTIIHRDLKASNILLDANMNPKISDFGLAKLFSFDSMEGNTNRIAGTYGYMAPEYAQHGIFSAKSDVFSYGVLVLEIVTGRRNTCTLGSGPCEDLLTYVWRHWSSGTVQQVLDGYPADDEPGRQEMLRCIHIGLLCVQEDPQLRPHMASVLFMLGNRIVAMSPPTKPAFAVPVERPTTEPVGEPSINKVSVSDLEAR